MKKVHVDLVSDPVCPWCWLGLRYWTAARQLVSGIDVTTTLRPSQLDPAIAPDGVPYRDYMRAKFGEGPSDRFKAMRQHLEDAAPDVGIVFNFDEIPIRPNTLNAHRLIRWAQGQELGEVVLDSVHKAFFEERRDIGDQAVLTQIGVEAGMDGDILGDLLATNRDAGEVLSEERFFRSLGVQGVPCFIFNGRFAVSGAESPQVLAEAITKAADLPPTEDM